MQESGTRFPIIGIVGGAKVGKTLLCNYLYKQLGISRYSIDQTGTMRETNSHVNNTYVCDVPELIAKYMDGTKLAITGITTVEEVTSIHKAGGIIIHITRSWVNTASDLPDLNANALSGVVLDLNTDAPSARNYVVTNTASISDFLFEILQILYANRRVNNH